MQLYKSKGQTHFHTHLQALWIFLVKLVVQWQQHGEPPQADLELTGDSFVQDQLNV
jgi:hypothetical protein